MMLPQTVSKPADLDGKGTESVAGRSNVLIDAATHVYMHDQRQGAPPRQPRRAVCRVPGNADPCYTPRWLVTGEFRCSARQSHKPAFGLCMGASRGDSVTSNVFFRVAR